MPADSIVPEPPPAPRPAAVLGSPCRATWEPLAASQSVSQAGRQPGRSRLQPGKGGVAYILVSQSKWLVVVKYSLTYSSRLDPAYPHPREPVCHAVPCRLHPRGLFFSTETWQVCHPPFPPAPRILCSNYNFAVSLALTNALSLHLHPIYAV